MKKVKERKRDKKKKGLVFFKTSRFIFGFRAQQLMATA